MDKKNVDRNTRIAFYEPEGNIIPFYLIRELFDSVEYGSHLSIFFKLLHNTGCRINESGRMKINHIKDNFLYWKLGKNQQSFRREYLSDSLIEEIKYYRNHNRIKQNYILSASGLSLGRQFRKLRNEKLSTIWNEKVDIMNKDKFTQAYKYQLKGFRKNFQTILFKYYWDKFNSPDVALEMVSKRMKHSSRGMTFKHYIENISLLGDNIDIFFGKMPYEWLENSTQTKIYQFYATI